MKIVRMTATFGKLHRAKLELSPGLNIIQAPNEGGKSTWCAFLRAMFYGIPTGERDTKTTLAEKNRYQPWAGAPMEGELVLEWQGRSITLRRGPKKTTPLGDFSAVYTDTGDAVPGLTAENCGETLLGVSREVFERSAFVGQGRSAVGESAELERRIAALVSSGEEDVSYSEADERLRAWLRRRRHNKSGAIPKLENELLVLGDTLARQEHAHAQAEEARQEIEAHTARRDALKGALERWRSQETQEQLRRYDSAQADLAAAQAEVAAILAERNKHGPPPDRDALRQAQEDLSRLKATGAELKTALAQVEEARQAAEAARLKSADPLFPDMDAEAAWRRAQADASAVEACRARMGSAKRWRWIAAAVLALVLAAALIGWQLLRSSGALLPFLGGLGGLLILAEAVTVGLGLSRGKKARQQAGEILGRYRAQAPEEILAAAGAYRERSLRADEACRRAQEAGERCRQLTGQREALSSQLLSLIHTFEPTVTDAFGISAAISRALGLTERLATAQVRLEGAEKLAASLPRPERSSYVPLPAPPEGEEAALGEPEQLQEELAAAERELTRLRSTLAMAQGELNTLGDAALFQARREELEGAKVQRQMEYDALTVALDRASEASLADGDSPLPRRTLLLSQGTVEQVYLAVRLAICRLALSDGERPPIVLDDALDAFDDARMALALDYLRRLGQERQLLLFTCHAREGAYTAPMEDVAQVRL